MLTPEQYEQLTKPLCPDAVKTRTQGKAQLSYVEGHYAIRKANEIFGFDGWTRRTVKMDRVVNDNEYKTKRGVASLVAYIAQVQVSVRVGDDWITTDGFGYGEGIDYNNPGQAHESAVKEAETDAMKRALIKFGDQFGLALYDKDQEHVGERTQAPAQKAPAEGNGADTATEKQVKAIFAIGKSKGLDAETIKGIIFDLTGAGSSKDLSKSDASTVIEHLNGLEVAS